jgi:hypothetical protein
MKVPGLDTIGGFAHIKYMLVSNLLFNLDKEKKCAGVKKP